MCSESRRETEGAKVAGIQNRREPPAQPALTSYLLEPTELPECLRSAQVGRHGRGGSWRRAGISPPPAFSPLAEPNQKGAGKGLWKIPFSGFQPP